MLYLARHGEQGPGGGLSPLGRDQAERLGRRLRAVPFAEIHHSALPRAAETADIVAAHLPGAPRHACDHAADRTPVPLPGNRDAYPQRWLPWLDGIPAEERDEDAGALHRAVEHFAALAAADRHDLVITHNFVIGWFVRHVLDAPQWRWIGLNHANCGLTIVDLSRAALVSYNDTGHL